jgi:hypothetical protein
MKDIYQISVLKSEGRCHLGGLNVDLNEEKEWAGSSGRIF